VPIERSDDTHTYYPYELLIVRCKEILQVGREIIERVFGTVVVDKRNVIEGLNRDLGEFRESIEGVCLAKSNLSQTSIYNRTKTLVSTSR
jgi:exodeoxyribonuclease V alpha subunit